MEELVCPGDLFIFYGLLRQEAVMASHIPGLDAAGQLIGSCRFAGTMFDAGGYPGIVEGNGMCHGLLWRITDVSVVPAMDAFEDVCDDPARSLYLRRRTDVLDEKGVRTGEVAWLYVYNQNTAGLVPVQGNEWPMNHEGSSS